MPSHRRIHLAAIVSLCALLSIIGISWSSLAFADSNVDVVRALNATDVYVTPQHISGAHISPGDAGRLQAQVSAAAAKNINEKFALVSHFPSHFKTAGQAVDGLRGFLDFSGVLILVAPTGIAISSDVITPAQQRQLIRREQPVCVSKGFATCAIAAGRRAEVLARSDSNSSFHDAAVFWIVLLLIVLASFGVAALALSRRRRHTSRNAGELRDAGAFTLQQFDRAVEGTGSVPHMRAEARARFERARQLSTRARSALDGGVTRLIEANRDAAEAMLELQGALKIEGIVSDITDASQPPGSRCFYCAHEDRSPYISRAVNDGRENVLQLQICSVCAARLQRGQTPPVATAPAGGAVFPWWAIPRNPWFVAYGGPAWQYWLPFMIGMDAASWFAGDYGGFGVDPDWIDAGKSRPEHGPAVPSADPSGRDTPSAGT
ncbi:MAG: hypothetical protein ACRDFX_07730 [Chloroflexota bacterium]